MRPTAIRLSAVTTALLLATACSSPPTGAPRNSAATAAAPTANPACLREGEACQRAGASCCSGMLCVGGDAGVCMPAN